LWQGPFQLPIADYLAISATYGGRRSYNGGPYRTYHEGVDFSAYRGTPVYAPAGGKVVLAEQLFSRRRSLGRRHRLARPKYGLLGFRGIGGSM
jgi:murein DD-endopeptidase MepM/ murein hydrolase activator NlpD